MEVKVVINYHPVVYDIAKLAKDALTGEHGPTVILDEDEGLDIDGLSYRAIITGSHSESDRLLIEGIMDGYIDDAVQTMLDYRKGSEETYNDFRGTLYALELWVFDHYTGASDNAGRALEGAAEALEAIFNDGWEAHGVGGYGEANDVMDQCDDDVWEAVERTVEGYSPLWAVYDYCQRGGRDVGSQAQFNEIMVGLAVERVARDLSNRIVTFLEDLQ